MSNNGEDIIRETFEKLGAAIGVQMQMPDAMIANLGAVLQAQIDLLAELQSTGRLIPAGGMSLTAEEWADVQTVSNCAMQYGNIASREAAYRLAVRFPATEPAEVISRYQTMQRGFAAKHFGFPANPVFEDRYTAPDGGKWQWTDELQWELRCYPPAPAVPAGEETKAELPTEVGDRIRASVTRWSSALEWPDSNPYIDTFVLSSSGFWDAENDQFTVVPSCFSYIEVLEVLPSPVVPAPTETGPWQRIEDVPEGVLQIKDRHGRTWLVVGGTWRFEWHDGNWYEPHTNINAQAPFVAAAEEG